MFRPGGRALLYLPIWRPKKVQSYKCGVGLIIRTIHLLLGVSWFLILTERLYFTWEKSFVRGIFFFFLDREEWKSKAKWGGAGDTSSREWTGPDIGRPGVRACRLAVMGCGLATLTSACPPVRKLA